GEAHSDGDGRPVPSRAAAPEEFLALVRAARHHEGTSLEFIPAMGEIPEERIELMAQMSLAANRPLNWNLLGSLSPTEVYEQQLSSCDHAAAHGVVAELDTGRDVGKSSGSASPEIGRFHHVRIRRQHPVHDASVDAAGD